MPEDSLQGSAVEATDPRIRRTRQMLQEALSELLQTQSIDKISVSDITERASLNRATFYDHYQDKFALFEGFVAARFQDLLSDRRVFFDGGCSSALMSVILAMCEYLAGLPGSDCAQRRQMESHFAPALMAVVREMVLTGMRNHAPRTAVPLELAAAIISGAIYGGVREWVRTPGRPTADEVAKSIFSLIQPILGPV